MNDNKEKHTGRAMLGFFLTFILSIFMIINGYLMSLRSSVLGAEDIDDMIDNLGVYDMAQEVAKEEMYDRAESLGMTKEAIDEIFPEDTIKKVSSQVTEAITSGKDIDLSMLKDDCMHVADDASEAVVDTVFKAVDETDKIFDLNTVLDNKEIKDMESNFGIDVSSAIKDQFVQQFGSTQIDITTVDTNELKSQVEKTLTDTVYPIVEEAFDSYVDEANQALNNAFDELEDEYDVDRVFNTIENVLDIFGLAVKIMLVIVIVICLLEILVYRKDMNRAFRNIGIASLLPAVIMFASTVIISFIKEEITKSLSSFDRAEKIVKDLIETNIDAVADSVRMGAIIYIAIFVAGIVASVIIKSRKKANEMYS